MALLTILMVINVFAVVLLRYVFSASEIWMQELYVWTHATVFMAGAGYTLLKAGHVRIDLFYRSASHRFKSWVDIVGSFLFAGPLLWFLWKGAWPFVTRSWENMERSAEAGGLPGLFVLKSVILAFCVLLALQISAMVIERIVQLIEGEIPPQDETPGDVL